MAGTEKQGSIPEYVADVAYLRNFVEELAPARLRLCAALNGFSPPPAEGFDYCELGAGQGDTIAALAAANPDARFVGVDKSPEHAAFARSLAERGGIHNLRFLEDDFEALRDRTDLPDFDYLAAHGVLSWVGPQKRRALIDFAAARLRPGGLFMVSYNALPGWAAVEPLRRLLLDTSAGVSGTTLDRARHGLAAARALAEAGAEYFTKNPAAGEMIRTMEQAGLAYVVHEYFHAHWSPLYFADVAREMAEAGLYFIGALPLHLNYKDLSLPPTVAKVLAPVQSRPLLESMRDYATNEFFRRDVYIKGQAPCASTATDAYFASTPFGAPGGVQRDVRLPHYTLQFVGPIFDALIPALGAEACTAADLALRPDLAPFGATKIQAALLRLALGDQIHPMRRSTAAVTLGDTPNPPAARVDGSARRLRIPLAYNRMVLEQRLSRDSLVALASPVSGTALVLSKAHSLALRILTTVEPEARPTAIREFVAHNPVDLYDGDRRVTSPSGQERLIARSIDDFAAKRLPELVALGIVEV
jgi:SAM-dependent methyltransferase